MFVDHDLILKEILDSFISNNYEGDINAHILSQFKIDYPRLNVTINNDKCNMDNFLQSTNFYKNYKSPILNNLHNCILMLLTQAIFYYPYNFIDTLLQLNHEKYLLVSDEVIPKIIIKKKANSIKIDYLKNFNLISIHDETIIQKCHSEIKIKINLFDIETIKYANIEYIKILC